MLDKNKKEIPLISFCIPTYNRAKYIDRCLNEISKISHRNIEIIVSDNCSSDDTSEIVGRRSNLDTRIKYHRNEYNLGQTGNVAKCFELSRGKYIYITSDEDLINLEFFENISNDLIINEPCLIFGSIAFNENKQLFSDKEQDIIYNSILDTKSPELYAFRGYISGIIYRSDCINLSKLKSFAKDQDNLYGYMPALLMCISRGTILTKKQTICYRDLAETQFTDYELKGIKLHYSQPESRILQLEYKIFLVNHLITNITYKNYLLKGLSRHAVQIQRDLGFRTCSEKERKSYRKYLKQHNLFRKYYYLNTLSSPKIIVKNLFYKYGFLK